MLEYLRPVLQNQSNANSIAHRHCCLSREVSKCVTVVTDEALPTASHANKCKPNFPQALSPLKGGLKVCNCRQKRVLEEARPRKQMQT